MSIRVLIAVVVASSLSTICAAQTTVVFDNLANAGLAVGDAVPNDLSATFGGETVDDVTLATTTQVTGVNWSGVYTSAFGTAGVVAASDDDFEIRIYNDAGGAPGTLLQSFAVGNNVNRTSTGTTQNAGGLAVEAFDFSTSINFAFNAGVTHWISFLNNTVSDTDNFLQSSSVGGFDAAGNQIGNSFGDFNPNDGVFLPGSFATDFQLTVTEAAIPEPSSAILLVLGSVGLLARRKRA